MLNNKFEEEIFDYILKNAFTDSFKTELDEYEESAKKYKHVFPSALHKKIARRRYKKETMRHINAVTILRRTAVAFLIIFSIGSGIILTAPAVRAGIVDIFVGFFDKYLSFDFQSKTETLSLGIYTLEYLPKGYVLSNSLEGKSFTSYTFTNNIYEFRLKCLPSGISEVMIDKENRTLKSIEMPGYTAYVLIPNSPGESNVVVWGDDICSFTLTGTLSIDELIKIAKNIH